MITIDKLLYESEDSLIYLEQENNSAYIRKVLRSSTPSPEQIVKFNNEYEYTKDLHLKGVRKAISRKVLDEHETLLLEYIDGMTLQQAFGNGSRPFQEVLEAFIQIADLLGKLHEKGIIHKDINDQNILWVEADKTVHLIDFGISSRLDLVANNLGSPDKIDGNLAYISPEQTGRVNRKIDSRCDLYSLGVTFFRILTGRLPFESTDSLEIVHFHIAKSVPLAHHINPAVPEILSKIIVRLMAKNAEDRYQNAFGLKYDLEKCLLQIQHSQVVTDFELGEQDYSAKFQIPQKLYGRFDEVKALLKAFEQVSRGSTQLFLVTGYSGVGKTALINEIYKPITEKRGYFVQGKFDQYQRNIPYYALLKAFTEFCNILLTERKDRLERWKNIIQESIGENGQVLLDLLPPLKNIIGPQPEVPKLDYQEAQNRLMMVFQNFIRCISKSEHPFVLFCDDLQWADAGSLNLIKQLITNNLNPYLLVIGAYRDIEVSAGHLLLNMIEDALKEKAAIITIELKPLREEHVFQLIKEALQVTDASAHDLTEIVFKKTMGNAFFTIEFLKSLYQLNLIKYEFSIKNWSINFDAIRKRSITNNVVELLNAKIHELPEKTQNVLGIASCVGGIFNLQLLADIYIKTQSETLADLWPAVLEGMVMPVDQQYQFIEIIENKDLVKAVFEFSHDRIQQAAHSLITPDERQRIHLLIGKVLLQKRLGEEEKIFDIVNHYNEGIQIITNDEERFNLAKLNLKAAHSARDSSAYTSALNYINVVNELVDFETIWEEQYDFALPLFTTAAEIHYLNGDFNKSEELIRISLKKAKEPSEKSQIYFMLMQNQSNTTKYYEAIESARQGLLLLDFIFPAKDECAALIPSQMALALSYFEEKGIESILQKPEMKDEKTLAIINILDNLSPPTYVTGEANMWMLHVLFKVNLTIEHGLTPQGGYSFSELGIIFFILNNYKFAYPSALISKKIAEKFKRQSPRHLSRAGHLFTNYNTPWVKHIEETVSLNSEYYQVSVDSGELIYAGYTSFYPIYNSYYQGKENLHSLLDRIPAALDFTKKIKHDLAYDSLRALQLVIANLAGKTDSPDHFQVEGMTEKDFISYCKMVNDGFGLTMLFLFKAQCFYLTGNYKKALQFLEQTKVLAAVLSGNAVLDSTYRMIYALTLLAVWRDAGDKLEAYKQQFDELRAQLKIWADNNASNFEHKYFLVEAEYEKVNNNILPAVKLYRKAVLSSEKYEFEREAALIHLKAGEFWLSLEILLYSQVHFQKARSVFEKLGYTLLVTEIDKKYSSILSYSPRYAANEMPLPGIAQLSQHNTAVTELDMQSVMKASQALSEEIILDKLVYKMLRIVIENAGGQRVVLLVQDFGKWKITADLNIEEKDKNIYLSKDLDTAEDIPITIINYVIRTRMEVVSNSGTTNNIFERDDYLRSQKPSSYLCLPLAHKGEIIGILYVEHKTSSDAFTLEHLSILRMLISQMAVSLENASLYHKQFELNKAYQRFVPHDFINALGQQSILQVKLGDNIDQGMTVMFCDIRSYTRLSENLSPVENFRFINNYLMRIGPVIRKHKGFVNHYLGDGLIALFKDDPADALNASVEMLAEIEKYNQERLSEGSEPIAIGIGLHSGRVMMGIIGDNERHDANVISDAVNIACRLEGLTKIFAANIILSDETLNEIKNKETIPLRYLGIIKVKGKENVLGVYEMFGADERQTKERKQQTLELFNLALKDYFDQHFAEAAVSLKKVLAINPHDKTARRYLEHAAKYLIDTIPSNWDGVEVMEEK